MELFLSPRRSFKYRIASHDNSIVIVGPSYAAAVGEANGIHNLALETAGMPQIKNQVAKVKPLDTPVLFLSIMDLIRQPLSQSHPFNSKLTWFSYIAKGVDFRLSGVRPKPRWATRDVQDKIEADRIRLFRKLANNPTKINLEDLIVKR